MLQTLIRASSICRGGLVSYCLSTRVIIDYYKSIVNSFVDYFKSTGRQKIMNDSVRFAKWLKQKIDYNHVTIYQISKESGIHQSTIKNWLNGAKPQTEKMDSVIQAIKRIEKSKAAITLAELDGDELPILPEDGAKKARPVIDEARYAELTDKEKQVLTLFHQIPEQEWDNMILAVEVALRSKGLLK